MVGPDSIDTDGKVLVTLGMFIIDDFEFNDEDNKPTGRILPPQIGGGGTYASIGARIWLPAEKVGMIVDRGNDFPPDIQEKLDSYGDTMWLYRDNPARPTTRALNSYRGDHRGFQYTTPRIRLTPRDLVNTKLWRPNMLHFICSPTRATAIMSEVREDPAWNPITIYEPIPDRCVPEELTALLEVLPAISVLSPNAEEAMSLLSMPGTPTKSLVEEACKHLLEFGVSREGRGCVVIRSGALGAYVATRERKGQWVPAFWTEDDAQRHIVDVTGAGNAFLGGLAAGLHLADGDVYRAALYGTVSASFIIEQEGLPQLRKITDDNGRTVELWNGDTPTRRLEKLANRSRRAT
ncbi:Ribokinase-like protein [Laetiporus sulphureus 93-53]|uniref:Ribokinase-like protein n=1 Tax=Laetiporus sulphureus 93-53 TaxID=1314785 RepID=A0A165IDZ9_9APHY|nr:Ribokinase-like protein [Laetiporus sulphureus 93-53]KZT12947.1 Ribokinase-like protein [Laetiporus sulphureus 93-53]